MGGFESLIKGGQSSSLEKILAEMMDKKNIEMKTEIPNPVALIILDLYASALRTKNMTISADTVEMIVTNFKLYMVSKDRKRAKEIVEAFRPMYEHEAHKIDIMGRTREGM